jgi:outer membrane protein assembly factor BamD (BamD/ComL family)
MPIDQRNAILKAKLKALRKEAGLKDLDNQEPGFGGGFVGGPSQDADLFATGANEFYFQNAGLKSRGYSEFKSKWGTRPNVDNWRRQAAVEKSFAQKSAMNNNSSTAATANSPAAPPVEELTMESLLAKLPLTSEQMSVSYLAILKASMENAALYQLNLGDYPSAITEYRGIVTQFPDVSETEKALFNLAICYDRNNQPIQADSVRQLLKTNFANGKYNKLVQQQGKPVAKDNATIAYEQVYDLFLAGSFKEALQVKETADKKWGKSYWTPQQLYIEAIYYVKNREDSIAINRLQEITKLFPNSPLKEKANTMVDVLKRRKEIETYLTDLKIEKPEDISGRPIELNDVNTVKKAPAPKAEITQQVAPVLKIKPNTLEPKEKPVIVAVAPPKVDTVRKQPTIVQAPPKVDTTRKQPTIVQAPLKVDTTRKQPTIVLVDAPMQKLEPIKQAPSNQYAFYANDPHFVAVVLDKVDGIFAGEAKNAFNRFNREQYSNQNLAIGNETIQANLQLVLVGPFANAGDAVGYINKAKPQAATRIVPWLAKEKYSFLILSGANLTVLKSKKDIQEYRTFLHGVFPDIF